jgi:ISXO2-like transposase domain
MVWGIYWVSSDKDSVSALRLTKLIGASWLTAQRMLRKLRTAMGDQNSLYRLRGMIELDDAFVGVKHAGKRRPGAVRRQDRYFLVACERNNGKPGFVAMKALERISQDCLRTFAEQTISPGQTLHTDAFTALKVLSEEHHLWPR